MSTLDRRLHAYRPDLADSRLAGQVEAARFVEGSPSRVGRGFAALMHLPDAAVGLDSQVLAGEPVRVFERKDGWAWLQSERDGYVGYCAEAALDETLPEPSHMVVVPLTPIFPEPDLKTPPFDWIPMAGGVTVTGQSGRYLERAGGGWIFESHLRPQDQPSPDYVATALRFLEAPYLWGGRGGFGLDCSALVQLSLALAGRFCRRDCDLQEADPALGARLDPDLTPRRGDLIYWRGHVAIALDAETVVHATAFTLSTVIEPLAAIDARARTESGQGIRCLRRPEG